MKLDINSHRNNKKYTHSRKLSNTVLNDDPAKEGSLIIPRIEWKMKRKHIKSMGHDEGSHRGKLICTHRKKTTGEIT